MKIAFTFNVKNNKPSMNLDQHSDAEFDPPFVIDGITNVLEQLGHSVLKIEADKKAFDSLMKNKNNIDLVFNIAEGMGGDARESQIPLFCEILGIPYTHSSPTTHAIKLDKSMCKTFVRGLGLKAPKSQLIFSPSDKLNSELIFPLILKPNKEGSSKGIYNDNVVHNIKEYKKQISKLFDVTKELLAEEYIDGREFSVALLGNPPKVLPIIEQRFDFLPKNFNHIASYECKWLLEDELPSTEDACYCPASVSEDLKDEIEKTSIQIYNELNAKDCARIDYRYNSKQGLYFIEINTLPGMNPPEGNSFSYFVLASKKAGITYKEMINAIIKNACKRYSL